MNTFTERLHQKMEEKTAEKFSAHEIQDFSENEQVELFEASEFFGKAQVRNLTVCFELRFFDGASKAYPYAFVVEVNFSPSDGIEIITTQKKILIQGRNLKILYSFLLSFQVRFIQENIGADQTNEEKVFVKKIVIEDL